MLMPRHNTYIPISDEILSKSDFDFWYDSI
jgi:hypothetical protein